MIQPTRTAVRVRPASIVARRWTRGDWVAGSGRAMAPVCNPFVGRLWEVARASAYRRWCGFARWGRQEPTPRPTDYESAALTTELRPRYLSRSEGIRDLDSRRRYVAHRTDSRRCDDNRTTARRA